MSIRDHCPYCSALLEGDDELLSIYNTEPFACPSCGGGVALASSTSRRFMLTVSMGSHAVMLGGATLFAAFTLWDVLTTNAAAHRILFAILCAPVGAYTAYKCVVVARVYRRLRRGRLLPMNRAGEPEIMRWERRARRPQQTLEGGLEMVREGEDTMHGALKIVEEHGALELVDEQEPPAKSA